MYKFMLDMDARLDTKFREAREQNKEDITNTLKADVLPLLREMSKRLEQGDTRFEKQDERLDEHSDRLNKKRDGGEEPTALTKKSGGWIPADKLPAIIMALGTLVATILSAIALMRSPSSIAPVAVQPAPSEGTPP